MEVTRKRLAPHDFFSLKRETPDRKGAIWKTARTVIEWICGQCRGESELPKQRARASETHLNLFVEELALGCERNAGNGESTRKLDVPWKRSAAHDAIRR